VTRRRRGHFCWSCGRSRGVLLCGRWPSGTSGFGHGEHSLEPARANAETIDPTIVRRAVTERNVMLHGFHDRFLSMPDEAAAAQTFCARATPANRQ
jgi:hypothetical protein